MKEHYLNWELRSLHGDGRRLLFIIRYIVQFDELVYRTDSEAWIRATNPAAVQTD